MVEWRYSSTIPDLCTRWRWVVSFMPRPLNTPGKSPSYPEARCAQRPVSTLWSNEKLPALAGNQTKPVQPVARCYTIRVIPAPNYRVIIFKCNVTGELDSTQYRLPKRKDDAFSELRYLKTKLRGFGPWTNYTDRATAACWRSWCQLLRIVGAVWSAQRIHTVVNLGFLDRGRYFSFQVAPQLSSRGWVDPVPDPLLLRKSGSAGKRNRDLWICSQRRSELRYRKMQQRLPRREPTYMFTYSPSRTTHPYTWSAYWWKLVISWLYGDYEKDVPWIDSLHILLHFTCFPFQSIAICLQSVVYPVCWHGGG
jgi:hypothetical protein